MKSISIKLTNERISKYLLEELEACNLCDLYISSYKFRIYYNVILHYRGENLEEFLENISKIISKCIINFYEINIIDSIIKFNYCYFDKLERMEILENVFDRLETKREASENIIAESIIEYIKTNKTLVLDRICKF